MKNNPRHPHDVDGNRRTLCHAVRPLLFEYMSHELPNSQTVLVREHLRGCKECSAEAAEIERTLDLLKSADPALESEPAFEPRRRARMLWLMEHPIVSWFFLHRRATGVLCAIVMLTAIFCALMLVKRYEALRDNERLIDVNISSQPILFFEPTAVLPTELEEPPLE